MTVGDFKLGTSVGALANIESMSPALPVPRVTRPVYELVKLGNGAYREVGFPVCEWEWAQLTKAQVAKLRTFCSGSSGAIYLRTLTDINGSTYANYLAVMVWPDDEDSRGGLVFGFKLRFEAMVLQT